jgi:hypothetical protein
MKEGWEDLVNNWKQTKEVELEFETNERGNNKVINLSILSADNIFI